ncbi:hypothetical protein ABZ920_01930 [Streptomyces sp. NPDC046831]|uniref:hypothetical protein n=1 Tax=Streptomyces sp. NPDC046831 TaxID=3154805 RepID=UPI00340154B4
MSFHAAVEFSASGRVRVAAHILLMVLRFFRWPHWLQLALGSLFALGAVVVLVRKLTGREDPDGTGREEAAS